MTENFTLPATDEGAMIIFFVSLTENKATSSCSRNTKRFFIFLLYYKINFKSIITRAVESQKILL